MAEWNDRSSGNLNKVNFCTNGACGNVATHVAFGSTADPTDDKAEPDEVLRQAVSEPAPVCESCATKMVGMMDATRAKLGSAFKLHPVVAPIGSLYRSNPKASTDMTIEERQAQAGNLAEDAKVNLAGNFRGMSTPRIWDREAAKEGDSSSALLYLHQRRTNNQLWAALVHQGRKLNRRTPEEDAAQQRHLNAVREINNKMMGDITGREEHQGEMSRWFVQPNRKNYPQKDNADRGTAFNPSEDRRKKD